METIFSSETVELWCQIARQDGRNMDIVAKLKGTAN
jgi:hypothetical protein